MSFDPGKTMELVKTGLTDPTGAWEKYFADGRSWQDTAMLLTGPLIVTYALLVALFTTVFGSFGGLMPGGGFFGFFLITLVTSLIGAFLSAAVFSFLAGALGGQANFSRAFAAVSLAWIPAALGGIVGVIIPWVGVLVALAAGILGLVYLYRLIPLALAVPDSKRVLHFIVGLVLVIIINMVIGSMIGMGDRPKAPPFSGSSYSGQNADDTTRGSGMVGAMQRQGELMDQAGAHRYDPPADGEVSKAQVEAYVSVMRKARGAQQRFTEKMEAMEESVEARQEQGLAGLAALGSAVTGAISAQNAEMEIVVTGGGNWAEHNWVKQQLQTAMIHGGEGSGAIEHNYRLFEPYREELGY